jgi:D-threo-aldose 1-dehydrogenase
VIDPFEKVTIGQGLEVPRFGLGCAHIAKQGEEGAVAIVREALDRGVGFFDTAPLYGRGVSERCVGRGVVGAVRDAFVLSTKVGRLIRDGQAVFDYSADGIRRSLDESLERLQLSRIDIALVHDPYKYYEQVLSDSVPVLEKWRDEGVVKAIGVGISHNEMLMDFARNASFDCFLLPSEYTLLRQPGRALVDLCADKGITIIAAGVYNTGILASDLQPDAKFSYKKAPPEIIARAEKLKAVCQRHGVTLSAAAIQFPFAHPAVNTMVVGADQLGQIDANIAALQVEISSALWTNLKDEGLLETNISTP